MGASALCAPLSALRGDEFRGLHPPALILPPLGSKPRCTPGGPGPGELWGGGKGPPRSRASWFFRRARVPVAWGRRSPPAPLRRPDPAMGCRGACLGGGLMPKVERKSGADERKTWGAGRGALRTAETLSQLALPELPSNLWPCAPKGTMRSRGSYPGKPHLGV